MTPISAFDFLERPARSAKPRKTGLSIASDKSRSPSGRRRMPSTA